MFKARQLSHLISPLPASPRSMADCEEGQGKIPETSRSRPHSTSNYCQGDLQPHLGLAQKGPKTGLQAKGHNLHKCTVGSEPGGERSLLWMGYQERLRRDE